MNRPLFFISQKCQTRAALPYRLYSVQNDYYTLPYDFSQSPVYAFWSWTTVETKLCPPVKTLNQLQPSASLADITSLSSILTYEFLGESRVTQAGG